MAYKKVVDSAMSAAAQEAQRLEKSRGDKERFAKDLAEISLTTLRDAVIAKEAGPVKGSSGKGGSEGSKLHRKLRNLDMKLITMKYLPLLGMMNSTVKHVSKAYCLL